MESWEIEDFLAESVADLKKGADFSQLQTLKWLSKETTMCTICITGFKFGDEMIRLKCKHHFHKACVIPWLNLNNNCPNCRRTATDK